MSKPSFTLMLKQKTQAMRYLPKVMPEIKRVVKKLGKDAMKVAALSDDAMQSYAIDVHVNMEPWARSLITQDQLVAHLVEHRTWVSKKLAA